MANCILCNKKVNIFTGVSVDTKSGKQHTACSSCYELIRNLRKHDNSAIEQARNMLPSLTGEKYTFLSGELENEKDQQKLVEAAKLEQAKYNASIKYSFTASSTYYKSNVSVFEDSVIIKREGRTSLPQESRFYFEDMTAITCGQSVGHSWITFSVPGVNGNHSNIVTAVKPGTITFGSQIPSTDPCSVIFHFSGDAFEHHEKVNKIYNEYRAARRKQPVNTVAVQTESSIDKLKKLKDLYDLGILSEAEYEEKRQKLLTEI